MSYEEQVKLDKEEEYLVEEIKELLWSNPKVASFINRRINNYWGNTLDGSTSTDLKEEFVCQVQVQIMNNLLAKVMVA